MGPSSIELRSPREYVGGYILLSRLIDKVRLHAKGRLPDAYTANFLGSPQTLDGRFLAVSGPTTSGKTNVIHLVKEIEEPQKKLDASCHLFPVGHHALLANTLKCARSIFGAP